MQLGMPAHGARVVGTATVGPAALTLSGCGVSSARMVVTMGPPSPHTTIVSPSFSMPAGVVGGRAEGGEVRCTPSRIGTAAVSVPCSGTAAKRQEAGSPPDTEAALPLQLPAGQPLPLPSPLTSTTSIVVPRPSICFTSSTVHCRGAQEGQGQH